MKKSTMPKSHTVRNPKGVVTTKPIALRLMPGELDDAKRIAKAKHCSRSSLAREAYLAGLPLVAADVAPSKA